MLHFASAKCRHSDAVALNIVKVFKADPFEQVATIPTGALPHGLWPSGDGTRVYVGLENADTWLIAVLGVAKSRASSALLVIERSIYLMFVFYHDIGADSLGCLEVTTALEAFRVGNVAGAVIDRSLRVRA